VYNTLNLFVEKGLLRALTLAEGKVLFDPKTEPHHHVVDAESGRLHDVPWEAFEVRGVDRLRGWEVSDYQVVVKARPRKRR
jgi:Fur family iron response transcriptional regulator